MGILPVTNLIDRQTDGLMKGQIFDRSKKQLNNKKNEKIGNFREKKKLKKGRK